MAYWTINCAPTAGCSNHRENEKQDSENVKKTEKSSHRIYIKFFSENIKMRKNPVILY